MERPSSLGFGLDLRPQYYREILEGKPRVDWFEVISENFMVPGGQPLAILERIRNAYPIVMHGVSMSIASTAPLDREYLAALKALAERFQPEWITDQLQRENRIKMRVTPKTTPIPEGPWIHIPQSSPMSSLW